MVNVLVYKRDDGGLSILIPSAEYKGSLEDLAKKDIPKMNDGTDREYRICDSDKIPSDRYFRSCWTDEFDTDTVDVDIKKARDFQMNQIRRLRNEKFKVLDIEFIKSLEKGDVDKSQEISNEKQRLRDIPQTLDLSFIEDLNLLKQEFAGLDLS